MKMENTTSRLSESLESANFIPVSNSTRGGFVFRTKDGSLVEGNVSIQDGKFTKDTLSENKVRPTDTILADMAEKGLWGSYIFLNNLEVKDDRDLIK